MDFMATYMKSLTDEDRTTTKIIINDTGIYKDNKDD